MLRAEKETLQHQVSEADKMAKQLAASSAEQVSVLQSALRDAQEHAASSQGASKDLEMRHQRCQAEIEELKTQRQQDAAVLASLSNSLQAALGQQQASKEDEAAKLAAADDASRQNAGLQAELRFANEQRQEREAACAKLEGQLAASQERAQTYLADLERITAQLAALHKESHDAKDRIDALTGQLAAAAEEQQALREQLCQQEHRAAQRLLEAEREAERAASALRADLAACRASQALEQATHLSEVAGVRSQVQQLQRQLELQKQAEPSTLPVPDKDAGGPSDSERTASSSFANGILTCAALPADSLRSSCASLTQAQAPPQLPSVKASGATDSPSSSPPQPQPPVESEQSGGSISRASSVGSVSVPKFAGSGSIDSSPNRPEPGRPLSHRLRSRQAPTDGNPVCVSLSGFKPGYDGYDLAAKKEQIRMAKSLGFKVHSDSQFTRDITHVVAPPGCRTMKVLGATLLGRWVVDANWLPACKAASALAPPAAFGCVYENPYSEKRFFLTASFRTEAQSMPQACGRVDHATKLIGEFSNGLLIDAEADADFVIMGDSEAGNGPRYLTFTQFVEMIPLHRQLTPEPAPSAAASTPPKAEPSPAADSSCATVRVGQ